MCCSQPWLVKCHYCMHHHRCFPCTYIIYTSKGTGGQERDGGGGGGAELRGAHVQLRLAMWRDKYGSMRGAHATAGFDDYMLRHPYDMLIDSTRPHPSFAFTKPSGIYSRHYGNKAESLSTLEVHWSKTMAWLFINQLSLANCLLRWAARGCDTLQ